MASELPEIARRLRFFMKKAGLSRAQLVERVGLTAPAIWLWLAGKTSPTYENLKKFCVACGIDVPTFYGPFDDSDDPSDVQEEDEGSKDAAAL